MKKKSILILFFLYSLIFSGFAKAEYDYLLIIGTYRQGPGRRPEVSGITSPSLHSIPMKDKETCNKAGIKITNDNSIDGEDAVIINEVAPTVLKTQDSDTSKLRTE